MGQSAHNETLGQYPLDFGPMGRPLVLVRAVRRIAPLGGSIAPAAQSAHVWPSDGMPK